MLAPRPLTPRFWSRTVFVSSHNMTSSFFRGDQIKPVSSFCISVFYDCQPTFELSTVDGVLSVPQRPAHFVHLPLFMHHVNPSPASQTTQFSQQPWGAGLLRRTHSTPTLLLRVDRLSLSSEMFDPFAHSSSASVLALPHSRVDRLFSLHSIRLRICTKNPANQLPIPS